MRSSTDGPDHIVLNQPRSDLILDHGDGLTAEIGQMDPVQKQVAGVQESPGPLLASTAKPVQIACESDPAYLLGGRSLQQKLRVVL